MLELYKKGFGGNNLLGHLSKSDRDDFYWFLTSVMSQVSCKMSSSEDGMKQKTYRNRVTVTNEAFVLMVLQHHCYKWKPENEIEKKK